MTTTATEIAAMRGRDARDAVRQCLDADTVQAVLRLENLRPRPRVIVTDPCEARLRKWGISPGDPAPTRSCTKCKHHGAIDTDFGWRTVNGKRYSQPWCKLCRTADAKARRVARQVARQAARTVRS